MEDILELILSVLLFPFEDKIDDLYRKLNRIPNRFLRIVLKTLSILVPFLLIFGLVSLCSFLFRGYFV